MRYYSSVEGHGAVYGRPVDLMALVKLGLSTEIICENVRGLDVGKMVFSPSTAKIIGFSGKIGVLRRYLKHRYTQSITLNREVS